MRDPNRRIIMFQWIVIAALIVGSAVGGYMLIKKTNDTQDQLDQQNGDLISLRNQLKQATSPTPTPSPTLPAATNNVASPTPTASHTPTPTAKATTPPK
jgi:hypothetical protein